MSELLMVGLDGSHGGQRALDYALKLARSAGAEVLLVSILTGLDSEELPTAAWQAALDASHRAAHERILAPALLAAAKAGVDARSLLAHGPATETLCRLARENSVSTIVVGRRGLSRIKALVFGSVASNLAQASPVPVVVVPE